jgi:hypothetical protein
MVGPVLDRIMRWAAVRLVKSFHWSPTYGWLPIASGRLSQTVADQ